jgi:hypothetical protein
MHLRRLPDKDVRGDPRRGRLRPSGQARVYGLHRFDNPARRLPSSTRNAHGGVIDESFRLFKMGCGR